jgi:hypothetical protein
LKALEERVAALPKPQRERAERKISAIGRAVIEDPEAVRSFTDFLDEKSRRGSSTLAQLETSNVKRVLGVWQRVLDESLPATELTQLGLSRQQLKHLRDKGKLIGLQPPLRKGFIYPTWQFDPQSGHPFESLPKIVEEANEAHLDGLDLHLLMTSAAAEQGTSPSEWLSSGNLDYVLEIIRGSSDVGS